MLIKQGEVRIPKATKNKRKWFQVLSDFANSNQEVVEIIPEEDGYKTIHSCHSTLCTAIRRYGFAMNTITQDDRLYLIKRSKSSMAEERS